tara:strand:+ start:1438 stop:1617 length:180 start_codon:yes stop_codon:yes gene_type:complete
MFTTNRETAFGILEDLRMYAVSDEQILDYIIGNNLPAHTALQLMRDARDEFLPELNDDD